MSLDIFGEQHRLERMLQEKDAEIEQLRERLRAVLLHVAELRAKEHTGKSP